MIYLIIGGPVVALGLGLAIAADLRDRLQRRRHGPGGRIEAQYKAGSRNGAIFPPPYDGRPL